jgi:hypothetical protein
MFNLFKAKPAPAPAHKHNWVLVACNDEYHTSYTDTKEVKHWHQRFYKCSCGERKHTDNRPSHISHKGIEQARDNWVDVGVVPGKSYYPDNSTGYVKPSDEERKALDPLTKYQQTLEDIQATLLLVTRNIELEEKYPELKESYLKHMELYRERMVAEKLYGSGKQ